MPANVSLVPVPNIDAIWPHLRAGYEEALAATGRDLSTGDLWIACRSGSAYLLVAHEGDRIVGSSIWRSDMWESGRKLRCLALYGAEANGWIDEMKATAIRIAKDCGATSLVAEGRRGWQRVFKNARVLRQLYEEDIT